MNAREIVALLKRPKHNRPRILSWGSSSVLEQGGCKKKVLLLSVVGGQSCGAGRVYRIVE